MNREPCRITDDPSYDYSDYCEGKGVYEPYRDNDHDADAQYDEWRLQNPRKTKLPKGPLDPLITSHEGDKDERME